MALVMLYWCAQGGMKLAAIRNTVSFHPRGFNCFIFLCNWDHSVCGCVFKCTSVCSCHAISRWQIWNWRWSPNSLCYSHSNCFKLGVGKNVTHFRLILLLWPEIFHFGRTQTRVTSRWVVYTPWAFIISFWWCERVLSGSRKMKKSLCKK